MMIAAAWAIRRMKRPAVFIGFAFVLMVPILADLTGSANTATLNTFTG